MHPMEEKLARAENERLLGERIKADIHSRACQRADEGLEQYADHTEDLWFNRLDGTETGALALILERWEHAKAHLTALANPTRTDDDLAALSWFVYFAAYCERRYGCSFRRLLEHAHDDLKTDSLKPGAMNPQRPTDRERASRRSVLNVGYVPTKKGEG